MLSFFYGLLLLVVGVAGGGVACYYIARQGWWVPAAPDRDPYLNVNLSREFPDYRIRL